MNMRRVWKITGLTALCLLAAAVLAGGLYYTWLISPPPLPAAAEDVVEVMTSPRYLRLSEGEREPYVTRARELMEALPQEQQQALREKYRERAQADPQFQQGARAMMTDMMFARVREFARATPENRRNMLDQMIAMQQMMGGRGGGRGPGFGAAPSAPRSNAGPTPPEPTPEEREARRRQRMDEARKWIQDTIEKGNPQRQAMMMEFFQALRDRREELGLDPEPWRRDAQRRG